MCNAGWKPPITYPGYAPEELVGEGEVGVVGLERILVVRVVLRDWR